MKKLCANGMRVTVCGLWVLSMTLSSGCATLLRGGDQTVRVKTYPSLGTVRYDGQDLFDGNLVTVRKGFFTPQFTLPSSPTPIKANMKYQPDPLLLGDAALLFAGVVPGVVALGVDFATGSWRRLDEEQTVDVPGPVITPAAFRTSYPY